MSKYIIIFLLGLPLIGCKTKESGDVTRMSIKQLEESAANGDGRAMLTLGYSYKFGHNAPQDFAKAAQYFQLAAANGDPDGEFEIGICYGLGQGVKKDRVKALEWCCKAGDKNCVEAQRTVGISYLWGYPEIPTDPGKAFMWLKRAADGGDPPAIGTLGKCYLQGIGTPTNITRAVECFRKAASLEYCQGAVELAKCYVNGIGVEQDPGQAAKWLRMAANGNSAEGEMLFGLLYAVGGPVERDVIEADKWFILAGKHDVQGENYGLRVLSDRGIVLNQEQKREAETRADIFLMTNKIPAKYGISVF
jgi:TPR repeat protein